MSFGIEFRLLIDAFMCSKYSFSGISYGRLAAVTLMFLFTSNVPLSIVLLCSPAGVWVHIRPCFSSIEPAATSVRSKSKTNCFVVHPCDDIKATICIAASYIDSFVLFFMVPLRNIDDLLSLASSICVLPPSEAPLPLYSCRSAYIFSPTCMFRSSSSLDSSGGACILPMMHAVHFPSRRSAFSMSFDVRFISGKSP